MFSSSRNEGQTLERSWE